jgi:peptide/nickel transport system permease protein
MLRFVVRRLLVAALLVVALLSVLFFIVRLLPGDPLAHALTEESGPEDAAVLRHELGLDAPLLVQYGRWLAAWLLRGDFGTSFAARRPVAALLRDTLPNTLVLAGLALLLRFTLGVVAGTWAALRHGTRTDRALVMSALVLYSIPAFWLGVMLQLVFAYTWHWLPPDSRQSLDAATLPFLARGWDLLRHLVLPVCVLGLGGVASTARYMRASLLETLSQDHVRAARARGLSERAVLLRHALRNALAPIVTLLGMSLPALVGGALVVETIFSWPGMGRLAVSAVGARDYPVILATTFLSAVLVVAGNLIADVACSLLDPRVRLE